MTDSHEPRTDAGKRLLRKLGDTPRPYADASQRGSWDDAILAIEAEARSSHSDVSADPEDPTRQLREHLHTFHSPVFDAEHLRALSDVATPGPWELGRKRVHGISAPNGDGYHTVSVHGNDAALIVAAVNAVRAALGEPR